MTTKELIVTELGTLDESELKELYNIVKDLQFKRRAKRESLARQRRSEPRQQVHLATFNGNGLLPGVDLDDSAALLDMD